MVDDSVAQRCLRRIQTKPTLQPVRHAMPSQLLLALRKSENGTAVKLFALERPIQCAPLLSRNWVESNPAMSMDRSTTSFRVVAIFRPGFVRNLEIPVKFVVEKRNRKPEICCNSKNGILIIEDALGIELGKASNQHTE